MPSDEPEPNFERAKADLESSHRTLNELLDLYSNRFGQDALWVFLRIQSRICDLVLDPPANFQPSTELLRLNRMFHEKAIDLFKAFAEGDFSPDRVSAGWCRFYEQFQRDRFAIELLTPLMAKEHILTDLENVLFFANVDKELYDAALDLILQALDEVRTEYFPNLNLVNKTVALLQHTLAHGISRLVLKNWRELAWQSLQRRRRCGKIALAQQTGVNLILWCKSGWPQKWVEDHGGKWGHADWLNLLEQLKATEFWPMLEDEIGLILEQAKKEYSDLPG